MIKGVKEGTWVEQKLFLFSSFENQKSAGAILANFGDNIQMRYFFRRLSNIVPVSVQKKCVTLIFFRLILMCLYPHSTHIYF